MGLRSGSRIIIMSLERSLMSGSGRRCALSKIESFTTDLRFLRGICCLVAKKIAVSWVASMKSRNGSWTWNHVTILSSAWHDLLVRSHHCCRPRLVQVVPWSLSTLCGGRVRILSRSLSMVHGFYLNMVFFTNSCHSTRSWEILSHCYWGIFVWLVGEQLSVAVSIIVVHTHVLTGLVSVETRGMQATMMIMSDLICLKVGVAFLVKATVNVWRLLSPLELHRISVDHVTSLTRVV